ncbi:phospholipid/cholesterol/gamma-HCH transport system substrate-binding protein [Mycobacterium sp. OAS707]|uniref:virulence factor Mce family protein n=1 Tax=Mycobacterium sp. OAS707 TaxID=2663822 RepID=UPI00178B4EE2|nr:virulence factor Mce family protein [Mycobacterium sp. OAS707]MBE1549597.1 phospholipid/cholesterol/gamma-HCH transport system substrate-binding protein [Mycobacterium sp. OAS707]
MKALKTWIMTAVVLGLTVLAGVGVMQWSPQHAGRTNMVAYFDNTNGLFVGDNVIVLGVKVGTIEKIEPQRDGAKVNFWVDKKYKVPAEVRAVILSPKLITSRAIQLTPAYTGGAVLTDGAVIPRDRTAVPVEFDDFRRQLQKLTDSLQPTQPGGVSPMGQFINTAADNLRGQGAHIRDTIISLSQAISALGDHSADIFATVKNLSTLVAALHDSADLMRQLNNNLASVTTLMTNAPDEIAHAVDDFNVAIKDVTGFVADNREALGTTTDKLGSITQALVRSLDDVKQTLHVLPNVVQNVTNIYEPAHGAITGILSVNNFANPISFLCGAIQAASRLNNEASAKLCVQYLAPIVKNRQYNNLPIGMNPLVNAQARPNEVTYSEDWMRPDYRPNPPPEAPTTPPSPESTPMAAEVPTPTDPAAGLAGMMLPGGG